MDARQHTEEQRLHAVAELKNAYKQNQASYQRLIEEVKAWNTKGSSAQSERVFLGLLKKIANITDENAELATKLSQLDRKNKDDMQREWGPIAEKWKAKQDFHDGVLATYFGKFDSDMLQVKKLQIDFQELLAKRNELSSVEELERRQPLPNDYSVLLSNALSQMDALIAPYQVGIVSMQNELDKMKLQGQDEEVNIALLQGVIRVAQEKLVGAINMVDKCKNELLEASKINAVHVNVPVMTPEITPIPTANPAIDPNLPSFDITDKEWIAQLGKDMRKVGNLFDFLKYQGKQLAKQKEGKIEINPGIGDVKDTYHKMIIAVNKAKDVINSRTFEKQSYENYIENYMVSEQSESKKAIMNVFENRIAKLDQQLSQYASCNFDIMRDMLLNELREYQSAINTKEETPAPTPIHTTVNVNEERPASRVIYPKKPPVGMDANNLTSDENHNLEMIVKSACNANGAPCEVSKVGNKNIIHIKVASRAEAERLMAKIAGNLNADEKHHEAYKEKVQIKGCSGVKIQPLGSYVASAGYKLTEKATVLESQQSILPDEEPSMVSAFNRRP